MLEMIQKLGLLNGLLFWYNLKIKKNPSAMFPGINAEISWRRNGYDETTIREILLDNQYDLPVNDLEDVNIIIDAGV